MNLRLSRLSARQSLAGMALLALAALLFALFSQHVLGLAPCAWCVLQRLILIGMIAVAGAGWWLMGKHPVAGTVSASLATLLALGGIVAAWYQHTVAANTFSCDLSFADRVITGSGLDQLWPAVFGIYATCADEANLLGLPYELWALMVFVGLALLGIRCLAPRPRSVDDDT